VITQGPVCVLPQLWFSRNTSPPGSPSPSPPICTTPNCSLVFGQFFINQSLIHFITPFHPPDSLNLLSSPLTLNFPCLASSPFSLLTTRKTLVLLQLRCGPTPWVSFKLRFRVSAIKNPPPLYPVLLGSFKPVAVFF